MDRSERKTVRRVGKENIIYSIVIVLLVGIFALTYYNGNEKKPMLGDFGENFLLPMKGEWKRISESESGDAEVYSFRIPERDNLMLSFTASNCPIDLYLGKKKIFHFDNKQKINVRAAYFQELPSDSAGKELLMRVSGSEAQAESISASAYIGSHRAVIEYFLHRTIYTCFISVFLMLLGGMIILANLLLHTKNNQGDYEDIGFSYLGLFMIVSGIWMLNDSQFLMFFTDRYWRLGLFSAVFFCLMPVFLLLFIQRILVTDEERGGFLKYFIIPHLVMLSVYMILYVAASPAKEYVILAEHILVVISLLVCLGECIRDIRRTGSREVRNIMFGFLVFSVCCLFAFICYYFLPGIPYAGSYCLGFLIFSLILANAAIRRIVLMIQNGAESKTYQKLAYIDMMTGLGNRTAYMKECREMEIPMICIMLDINGLKNVNDNQGHQEGDELIMAAARSVREAFAPLGHCFRVGGDEFVVILEVRYRAMVKDMMRALEEAVERENRERSFPLSIACGYAVPKDEEDSFDRVYREADEKMYAKKKEMKQMLGMPQRA